MSLPELRSRLEIMSRRINSLTKGLLEARSASYSQGTENETVQAGDILPELSFSLLDKSQHELKINYLLGNVMYLHRTVKDYFQKEQVWDKMVSVTKDTFNAHILLSRGYLMSVKTINIKFQKAEFWNDVICCLVYASIAEKRNVPPEQIIPILEELDLSGAKLVKLPMNPTGDGTSMMDYFQSHLFQPGRASPHWPTLHFGIETDSSIICRAAERGLLHYVKVKFEQSPSRQPNPHGWPLLDSAVLGSDRPGSREIEHVAGNTVNTELVKFLLNNGADPNRKRQSSNSTTWTELVARAKSDPEGRCNWLEIIELFIRHGADPKVDLSGIPGVGRLSGLIRERKRRLRERK
jgi:hypothetical protein